MYKLNWFGSSVFIQQIDYLPINIDWNLHFWHKTDITRNIIQYMDLCSHLYMIQDIYVISLLPPRHTDGILMRLPKEWTVSFKIPIFIRLFSHSISLRHFFPLISRNIYTNSVTSASIASYLFHMIYKDIISHHFHCTSFIKQVYNTQVFV